MCADGSHSHEAGVEAAARVPLPEPKRKAGLRCVPVILNRFQQDTATRPALARGAQERDVLRNMEANQLDRELSRAVYLQLTLQIANCRYISTTFWADVYGFDMSRLPEKMEQHDEMFRGYFHPRHLVGEPAVLDTSRRARGGFSQVISLVLFI